MCPAWAPARGTGRRRGRSSPTRTTGLGVLLQVAGDGALVSLGGGLVDGELHRGVPLELLVDLVDGDDLAVLQQALGQAVLGEGGIDGRDLGGSQGGGVVLGVVVVYVIETASGSAVLVLGSAEDVTGMSVKPEE